MGEVVFGDDDNAGRLLIEAVNDAGAELVIGIRTAAREVLAAAKKRVYQSPLRVPCTGMDAHSSRLINDQQVVVLVENVERDGFRFGAKWRAGTDLDNNPLAAAKFVRGLSLDTIYGDQTVFNQLLQSRARKLRACLGKPAVEAETASGVRHQQFQSLRLSGHSMPGNTKTLFELGVPVMLRRDCS